MATRQRRYSRSGKRPSHDLLLHIFPSRFLRLPFRLLRECGTLAWDEWKDDLHNKKGGVAMNGAIYFAHGLILGGILVGFAWIVLRK